jgi:hypothetical protein
VAYLLFLLANAALFIRPAELFPALGNVQVYLALIATAALCNLRGLDNQWRMRTLIQQPLNLCVLGVIVATPASTLLATMNFSVAGKGFIEMVKVGVYYLMLTSLINTPQRMRQFLMTTALCCTVMVVASILDFQAFKAKWEFNPELYEQLQLDKTVNFEDRVIRHAVDIHGADVLGNPLFVFRMRGLGIFNDPNDVALLIGVALVICVYFLTDRSLSLARLGWLVPIAVLMYGYLQTESRGGLLAIGAAGMVWAALRYGGTVAITLGVLAILAAPLALGRAADMNVSDGSGQERIQIWGEGLAAMKSPAFFTGIGLDQFFEVAGHVAHNSYIHAFVELGFIGGSLFFGCFFLPALAFYSMKRHGLRVNDYELQRLLPYIAAVMTVWAVGMATLSRCYTVSTYMIVGVCAAYINLAGYYRPRPMPIVTLNSRVARLWAACSFGLLVASFAFVKLLARWSA